MVDACKSRICVELIQEAVQNGQSTVIWCRYKAEIEFLQYTLAQENIESVLYYSEVNEKGEYGRIENVRRFQAKEVSVFIGQPQSGGLGLNLWISNLQIWYSHIYSSMFRAQAEDRCHRKGSEIHKSVQYYDLCAVRKSGRDTIDQWILSLMMNAKAVADVVTDDSNKIIDSI